MTRTHQDHPRSLSHLRNAVLLAICVMLVSPSDTLAQEKSGGDWIQLFNGKNLDGWHVKITSHDYDENFANTFRVEDGLLKVRYDGYGKFDGQFGHLFYEKPFSSYRLRVEYRFVGDQAEGGPGWAFRNSGLMLHGQSPQSMEKDQEFPASIEVQLLGGGGSGERTTSNLCTPATHVVMKGKLIKRHCTNSTSETYHGDQWVTAIVEVRDGLFTHIIDDKAVLTYSEPQLDENSPEGKALLAAGQSKMLTGGTISVQSESHPVDFRKIELMVLDD